MPSLLLTAAVVTPMVSLIPATAAQAATCTTVDINGGTTTPLSAPTLTPGNAKGIVGGCVVFDNIGGQKETVTVTGPSSLTATLTKGKSATLKDIKAGTYQVKVVTDLLGLLGNQLAPGSGSIAVSAPASTSTGNGGGGSGGGSSTGGSSGGTHSGTGGKGRNATHSGHKHKVTGPKVANQPGHNAAGSGSGASADPNEQDFQLPAIPGVGALQSQSNPGQAPDVAPSQDAANGTPETAIPTTAPDSVQVAPAADTHGSSKGLPAAIAGLLILGVASAYARAMRMRRSTAH
jgi:hypothetical protein